MAYEAEISRANPGCFLFLIDQSGSMADRIADKRGGETKAQGVADAINDLLNDLVVRCTSSDGVRDYFDVGVIGYGEKVGPAFTGVLANRDLVPLSEVARHPSAGVSQEKPESPTWFGPVAKGDTAMCAALKRASEVLGDWVRIHPDSYPPIVINITDGDAKDGNPTEPAHHLASLSTKDGNVLVFNCHISAEKAKPILFPRDEKALPGFAPRLFLMSSTLPPRFREAAQDLGYNVVDDTRGFAFNTDLRDLVKFLDLGKHTLIAQVAAFGGRMSLMKTDTELQRDVMDELQWEPTVKAAEIGVGVKDGVVTLSGYVDSYYKKWAAERAASRVFGVKAVAEEIKVRLPGSLKRSDEDIARAASNVLEWNVAVPHDRVKVQVQDGVVALSGEVDWWYQMLAAEEAVRHLMGVVSVSNQITVRPAAKPQGVKDQIETALRRNALLDARRVTVETRGGKVILRGSVRNWAEREQVERAAWAAPGVSEVESTIGINPYLSGTQ